ncbi:hypothetical protein ILP86_04535 [Microbacterium sp. R1]|uniref:Uncharacterized protein n=1 Tax=Microbacterium phage vB_MoxS-R1 TaxID=2848881 RepID=A0A8F2E5F4_9CAUD|nr:hypothetical protein [Microbacterium sp. R1]YP_010649892.1 hypothetical protein PP419_gp12 [Microbacterium phage vB_MoxS-R1]MBE7953587.1 hypothetical protein [Microbacterium sp. R1]QWT28862.1 hypothetical protein vBMoxSR1_gp12 [Microbacterium phage vB_MoxS-R1]
MTQFASTLYPQTNPTNPILMQIRDDAAGDPIDYRDEVLLLVVDEAAGIPLPQIDHARRVLNRLANFTG